MKLFKAKVLLLLLLPATMVAQKKEKKPSLPEVFEHARFVYVEAIDGEEFNPGLDTADRLAIADLRDAIKAWGRYTLTAEREKADLVFVVRKGRLAEGQAGNVNSGIENGGGIEAGQDPLGRSQSGQQAGQQGGQFPGQQRERGPGFGAGGEADREDDLLKICQLKPDGKLSGSLWIHSFANGLEAPRLLLFTQFKDALEKAYPSAPASAPAKP
jgi:hypothetical protein